MSKEKSNWEILYGGTDMEVQIQDEAKQEVTNALVKVLKIPLKSMEKIGAAFGKLHEESAVYLGGDAAAKALVDSLTEFSLLAVVQEGRRLNLKSFEAWFQYNKQTVELMTGKKMEDVLETALKEGKSAS